MNRDVAVAREQQKMEKERRQAVAARQEMEEFERILHVQRAAAAQDREREVVERQLKLRHADEIRHQIIINEEVAKRERQKFLEDGNKLRAQREREARRMQEIKQRKLQELRDSGVPEKYWAELEAKRFG
jgi:hypothetical protein